MWYQPAKHTNTEKGCAEMESRQMSFFDPPAREVRLTQSMKILKYMMDFGSITPIEALKDLGVMRLGARIYDLEKQGFKILHERESGKNRYGEKTSYARYRLAKES